ncbi:MAG: response regulator [Candidatus Gribaldobacteria bacterium]|nr:response regulator [Candidatus Gribaldobacteria bacterium]
MERKKALIVDDEEVLTSILALLLSEDSWEVEIAQDSYDAIDKLLAEEFDLFITDLQMPELFGHRIWECVKNQKPDIKTKAIICSGRPGEDGICNYKDYGFDGRLAKPYRVDELFELVHSIFTSELIEQGV